MVVFRVVIDALFEAEDLDDALARLGKHFLEVSEKSVDAEEIFIKGEVHIYAVGDEDED